MRVNALEEGESKPHAKITSKNLEYPRKTAHPPSESFATLGTGTLDQNPRPLLDL